MPNEPKEFDQSEESASSKDINNPVSAEGVHSPVTQEVQGTTGAVENILDPVLARKQQKMQELSAKRESKELSPFDFDLNFIFQLNEAGLPLTRKDMLHETGNQALVLTREDLETLGCLDFIHASGERMLIEPESLDPNDVFILYPHEVGDEEQDA